MDHNAKFFNQRCLGLTRLVVILIIGVMFTCSDDNEAPLDPPAVPTGFSTLSISNDRAVLTWNAMGNTTHYFLSKPNTDLDIRVLGNSYTATNLKARTIYYSYLKACNSGGCSPRTNLIFTTTPSIPENLTVEDVTAYTVSLSWDISDGATHYVIDTGSIPITNQGEEKTSSTIPGLKSSTLYTLRVRACDGYGCSSEASIDVTTAPVAPTGFSVLSISDDRVVLTWDEMEGVTHYNLLQNDVELDRNISDTHYTATNLTANTPYFFSLLACNSGGCSLQTNLTFTTTPSIPKNLTVEDVTASTVRLSWGISHGATHYTIDTGSIQITRQGETNTSSTIPGLAKTTSYTLRVRACNGYGCSPEASIDVTTAPAVPEGLAVEDVTASTVKLSWGISLGATHYVIDTGSIQITNQGGESTSSTIFGLEGGTLYLLKVRACNDYGCSSEASIDVTTALTTPMNFTAKNITSAGVTLEWDAVTGAGEYIIYREKTPIATNTALTHTVVNLRFSTSYSFSVRACDSQGCSDPALKEVITLEAPDSFSTTYSNMESTTPDISRPVFVSSESCNILDYTLAGKARYSIDRNTIGSDEPVLPTIDPITGVVSNNGVATPGAYRVTVTVPENVDCNTNFLVYNTVTPADRSELEAAVDSGIGFHGNTGNFNYIITSQITDMLRLFYNKSSFNGDITEWDTSKVENMGWMFLSTKFNQDISGWNTSKVTDMSTMFFGASDFNQPLSNWDTSQVQDMNRMFLNADSFNQPLSNWDTSKVKYMHWMFVSADSFNQPLNNWDTSQVRDMKGVFHFATSFNQPLSNWDTSKVTDMRSMFRGASNFNQPLSNWDTSQVRDMRYMFKDAKIFDQDLSGWVVTNVREHDDMFEGSPMAGKAEQHPKWPTNN